jgi:hypothetical protein
MVRHELAWKQGVAMHQPSEESIVYIENILAMNIATYS